MVVVTAVRALPQSLADLLEGLLEPEPYARIGTSGMGGNLYKEWWHFDLPKEDRALRDEPYL